MVAQQIGSVAPGQFQRPMLLADGIADGMLLLRTLPALPLALDTAVLNHQNHARMKGLGIAETLELQRLVGNSFQAMWGKQGKAAKGPRT